MIPTADDDCLPIQGIKDWKIWEFGRLALLFNNKAVFMKNHHPAQEKIKSIDFAHEIYISQIETVHQQIPIVLTVNVINSSLVAVVLASYMGQALWLIFLALTLLLTVVRMIGWKVYWSRAAAVRSTPRWAIIATMGSGLSGLLWGAGSALLLPDSLVEQIFFCICDWWNVRRLSGLAFFLSPGFYSLRFSGFAAAGGPIFPRWLAGTRRYDGSLCAGDNAGGIQI